MVTRAPRRAVGSDCFAPMVEIQQTLKESPETLKQRMRLSFLRERGR